MLNFFKKKFVLITAVYWFVLMYIVAALLFWFLKLTHHANDKAAMQLALLNKNDPSYIAKASEIETLRDRKISQYIGEGSTFFAVIVIGAVFVFRAVRKEINLSAQQQNFMMAVTHELKTPIAIARLNLETLQKRKLDEEKQNKLISNTIHETDRLNSLCNNILYATQIDGGDYSSAKAVINVSTLIQESVNEFKNRFSLRKIDATLQENIYMNGESLLIQMLVNNLIDNALKYSPKDSLVHIKLVQEHNKIILSVADNGYGIKQNEKHKIFQKFYRSGIETTRTTKGTGLGLYLCSKIVDSHNGYITMTNNLPQGSIFTAVFKL